MAVCQPDVGKSATASGGERVEAAVNSPGTARTDVLALAGTTMLIVIAKSVAMATGAERREKLSFFPVDQEAHDCCFREELFTNILFLNLVPKALCRTLLPTPLLRRVITQPQ